MSSTQSEFSFLISSPTKPFYIILNTLKTCTDFYILSFLGYSLGSFEIAIPTYLIALFLITLVISHFFDCDKNNLTKKEKILMIFILLLNFAVIEVGLYFGWGTTKDLVVTGVQGRYFLPVFILIFYILASKKIKFDINNKQILVVSSLLFINLYVVMTIIKYFT